MNFTELLASARQGNQNAFAELYSETYNKNFYTVFRMVKNEADTLDILQDAYIKVYTKMMQFSGDDMQSFTAWTGRIATNSALDFMKKKSPVLFSQLENEDGEIAEIEIEDTSVASHPELVYDQKETSAIVQELLNMLPDNQRVAIVMFYVQQMSIKEIASSMECTENTVKSRLNYAKKKIQSQEEYLKKRGVKLFGVVPFVFFTSMLLKEADVFAATGVVQGTTLGLVSGKAMASKSRVFDKTIRGLHEIYNSASTGTEVGAGAGASAGAKAVGVATKVGMTIKTKLLIALISVAVIGAGGFGVTKLASSVKDTKQKESTEAQIDESTTEVAVVTEEASESTTEVTTEAVTVEVEANGDSVDYAEAYIKLLEEYKDRIIAYDEWQNRRPVDNPEGDQLVSAPVSIYDTNADGIPELLFVAQDENEKSKFDLHVYSIYDGIAEQVVYFECFDVISAGGASNAVFVDEHRGEFYVYRDYEEEEVKSLRAIKCSSRKSRKIRRNESIDILTDENGEIVHKGNGARTDELHTSTFLRNAALSAETLLIYNRVYTEDFKNELPKCDLYIYTYDEAIKYLKGISEDILSSEESTEAETEEVTLENELPISETLEMEFTSGAGAWYTSLSLNPDGTFIGKHYDANMGEAGDGYESTEYICEFSGKFRFLEEDEAHVYVLELESLTQDKSQGDEWIDGGQRYVVSNPYGIEGGSTFYLYEPGFKVADMPPSASGWVFGLSDMEILPCYVLYNVDEYAAFSNMTY